MKNTYDYICASSIELGKTCSSIPRESYKGKYKTIEESDIFNKLFLYAVFRVFFFNAFPPPEMFSIIKYGVEKVSEKPTQSASEAAFGENWNTFLHLMQPVNETNNADALSELYLHLVFDDVYLENSMPKYGKYSYEGIIMQQRQFFDDFKSMKFV